MRIESEKLEDMFLWAKVNRSKLYDVIRNNVDSLFTDKGMRAQWTHDNPVKNCCYVVTEFAYWYPLILDRDFLEVRITTVPNLPNFKHWFLRHSISGKIIDLTAEQFDNYEEINYDDSVRRFFVPSHIPGPSKRAKLLAQEMGYDPDWASTLSTLETHLALKTAGLL